MTNATTTERVLIVDDDQALLDSLRRTHRKTLRFHTACGGPAALETIERMGPFAVVVSDYQMPGMNGIEFLSKVRVAFPDTVRVMLTGNADLQSAIEAVNEGHIFRFLTKPCPSGVFASCVKAAQEQYRLRQTERILLEQTVRGSIEVLADVLALANPDAFGRSKRVQHYVRQIVTHLGLKHSWQYETAALLSQIGFISVPADIIDRLVAGQALSAQYERVLERHPAIARDLLGKIPRLERVAEMVAHQRLRHKDAAGTELDKWALLGSQILGVALDFDELTAMGATRTDALRTMRGRNGFYDPRLLKIMQDVELPGQDAVVHALAVKDLRIGMILDQDVFSTGGAKVVAKGNMITQGILARLRNYADLSGIPEPIRARVGPPRGGSKSRAA